MGNLIGLTGLAGSGKDTAASVLILHGYQREAFADRMRKAILALDPWVDRFPRDPIRLSRLVNREGYDAAKRDYPEVRRLLQRFGTEAGRDIHGTNCWVNLVLDPWLSVGQPHNMVITDCRFENEATAIKAAGGHIIEIVRPDVEALTGLSANHASEAGFDRTLIDATLVNQGTVTELHAGVLSLARYYEEN